MIEETGKVIRVEGADAWVETQPSTACGSCGDAKGCGVSVLASIFGRREIQVKVRNEANAVVGQNVIIGIPESGLLLGSLLTYLFPLALLFGFALGGHWIGTHYGLGDTEVVTILGGITGLITGFGLLKHTRLASDNKRCFYPVMIRLA